MFLLKTLPQQQLLKVLLVPTPMIQVLVLVDLFKTKSTNSGSSGSSSQGVANSLNESVISGIFASICLVYYHFSCKSQFKH